MAAAFLELREQHWPNEARLPAPRMTIEAEAEQFVTAGATPPLAREIIDRVMRQNLAKGDAPPHSLKFCRLTLERAARQHTEAGAPANGNGHQAPAGSIEPPSKATQWRGRFNSWLRQDIWLPDWSIRECPPEVVDEYRDRLRNKPPPGTSVARETSGDEAA